MLQAGTARGWLTMLGAASATLSSVLAASPAFATYSIAATDGATQEVGGAVTSCVQGLELAQAYGSAPGFGVVHAQAQLDTPRFRGRNRAVELLMQGLAPSEIVEQITASTFDSRAASRQYAIVDLSGRAAGFTGMQAPAFRDDRQGTIGRFSYSVQGNILTSDRVLSQAANAFEADGCDLAERLMRALEAGGENGEGDSRCTSQGIPSDGAFIQVDRMGEPSGSYLSLEVSDTAPSNPLPRLREMFDAWRSTHPCSRPSGADAAGTGGVGGGAAGAAGSASGGTGAAGMRSSGAGGAGGNSGTGAGGSSAGGTSGAPAAGAGGESSSAGRGAADGGRGPGGSSEGAPVGAAGSGSSATAGVGTTSSASTAASAGASGSAGAVFGSDASKSSAAAAHPASGCSVAPGVAAEHATHRLAMVLLLGLASLRRSHGRRLRDAVRRQQLRAAETK